ncbi:sulfotransferase [Roseovarius faecimaris]|uniref:Sulfotransferase n=1 Tax=Roseovarius faecimaris TaxID=2494550 RepID=A0A6I6J508_9RHOB|nr:sulfotransferase [Roseovarius faecimaris]QGX99848.1 sulfotransferase [Roseovarius faecimaris]
MSAPDFPAPVFVLAGPRSYSSLAVGMIGQHPELFGMPELNLFQCGDMEEFNTGENPDGTPKSPFWKSMRHGLLRALAEVFSGEQTPESIRMAERWLRTREQYSSAQVLQELAEAVAPRRIVEKSPGILRRQEFMNRMLKAAPHARFVHLVRSPIDQCKSALAAKGGIGVLLSLNSVDHRGEDAALEPQILWHDTQVQILRFLDQLPDEQFVTIRGEDLLNDTDETLGALCRWLGVSDAPEAIAAMKRPEDSPFACMGPPNAPLGNDVNFLKSPALREGKVAYAPLDAHLPWREDGEKLHPRVVALAEALGYDA